MRRLIVIVLNLILFAQVQAQIIEPVKWSFDYLVEGKEVTLIFKADIENNWHLYDTDLPEGGPISTQIVFEDSSLFEFNGPLEKHPAPIEKYDNTFAMNLRFFSNEATLTQKLRIRDDNPVTIKGYVLFMACDDETCLPPNEATFSFNINGSSAGKSDPPAEYTETAMATNADEASGGQSLWLFILISALAGFAAILTPCVFPMIPMTVSFFMRGSENRSKSIRNGIFFGLSIVLIFSLFGALFTFGLFGPNVGSLLSTHWIPNLLFFTLFLIFAISFFGAFEIMLPGSLVNRTDAKAEQGGLIGAFFMALTTVIVSFSCTGPFIGALIIEAIQDGGLRPLIGMFFFGVAFALPFTLLATFPSAMKRLPKSGGWLNSIKVVFAFILLAFGLKFLSNIDQVYGFNLISRSLYLAVWIVLFTLLGFYFLGKIKFSHDSDRPYLSTGRFFLAVASFTFSVYLFTGLLGSPLSTLSALLPPQEQKHAYLTESNPTAEQPNALCGPALYQDKLHLPHGLPGYFDFEQGKSCAEQQKKPIFLVFKGHACANCKKMESSVWADPRALKLLSEKYVIIALYTDDRTTLPEDQWITSNIDGSVKKTMGKKNLDFQIEKYETNSIPFHVIIEPGGEEHRYGVTFNSDEFVNFLEMGLE